MKPLAATAALLLLAACASPPSGEQAPPRPLFARLGRGDPAGLSALRQAFASGNPGYALDHAPELDGLSAGAQPRVVFVQSGEGRVTIGESSSDATVGDVVLLRPGQRLAATAGLGGVVFDVPHALPAELPSFVRPDWDPGITDVPGGCATETGAYRRILLTWLEANGPYVWHALNAHRVRIRDSFSHYHPREGGFDELYLVQMVQPGARLLTSAHVDRIERPGEVTRAEAAGLLESHELEVGDLVLLPRGLMHRGLGGVLAQVITVPGFRPGAEIGVDHHLRAIDERLGLTGEAALPYHAEASMRPVVR